MKNYTYAFLLLISLLSFTDTFSQATQSESATVKNDKSSLPTINATWHEQGVILSQENLSSILAGDHAIIGLAFKIYHGVEKETKLELLKVYNKQEVSYKTFASVSQDIKIVDRYGQIKAPSFKFRKVMKNSKFSFAFASRDQLELLLAGGDERFLLSGTKLRYDRQLGGKREVFTFILEAYPSRNEEMTNDGYLGTPDYCILEACPPFWTPDGL